MAIFERESVIKTITTAVVATYLFSALPALAFEQDSYRSGMSKEQVEYILKRMSEQLSSPLNETATFASYAAMSADEKGRLQFSNSGTMFSFRHAKLISYAHPVDFDADFAVYLEAQITRFGKGAVVLVDRQTWNGPGGGLVVTVRLRWYLGDERVELSFSPEGRAGNGDLRHNRAAQISFAQRNECWEKRNW